MAEADEQRERSRSPGFEFGENDSLQIDNPLIAKPLSQVKQEAHEFAKLVCENNPDEPLFSKAAAVARDPPNFETVDDLNPVEKAALKREKQTKIWRLPKPLRVTVVLLCLSAFVQGWAESIANVANLTWPAYFKLDIENSASDRLIFAGVNSVTWFAAAILGCGLADPLQGWAPWLGRRGMIVFATCLCIVGAIGSATCRTWQSLMGFRVIFGAGLGAKACVTPLFAAEISPSHLRGAIVMSWQLFVALGIACGFASSLIVFEVGPKEDAWRWQTASIIFPLISLLTLTTTCPESPRYLLKHGKYPEAYKAFCELHETPLQAARDMIYINAQIQVETTLLPKRSSTEGRRRSSQGAVQFVLQDQIQHLSYGTRLAQSFLDKRTRRAQQAASIVMLCQQLCGVNVVIFYSSNILAFKQLNLDGNVPYLLNLGVGLANFLFTFPAYWFIDSKGRRFLLLTTYPFMALTMLAAALSWRHPDEAVRAGLVITFIFLFVMAYSIGQGPVAFTYASEVFPLVYREIAFSFSVFVNLAGLGLLSLAVPFIQVPGSIENTSYPNAQTILLAGFAVLNVIAGILCFLFVPETAGTVISPKQGKINSMSLEELNYIFGVKTLRHALYQVKHMAPWIFHKGMYYLFQSFTRRDLDPGNTDILWTWARASMTNEKDDSDGEPGSESEKASGRDVQVEEAAGQVQQRTAGSADATEQCTLEK
ncbi:hypothetical protein LTR05_008240 [Lithohypha guttulata]|uniref:Major facilitator superfamily (MFS) profile domain-containing protein n=1 Tax=Lithohypha guttulata TaxID=1690604 RepID=A0AAN7Y8D9_9EURO|nr:hypothetical protein LTR05_008240 [Lithohypha guttulata]